MQVKVLSERRSSPVLPQQATSGFMRRPILHASEAASQPLHRRVLQIDYAVGSFQAAWSGWAFKPCDYRSDASE
jgi:hypothetical protein